MFEARCIPCLNMSVLTISWRNDPGLTKAVIMMLAKAPNPPVGKPFVKDINVTDHTTGSLNASTIHDFRNMISTSSYGSSLAWYIYKILQPTRRNQSLQCVPWTPCSVFQFHFFLHAPPWVYDLPARSTWLASDYLEATKLRKSPREKLYTQAAEPVMIRLHSDIGKSILLWIIFASSSA